MSLVTLVNYKLALNIESADEDAELTIMSAEIDDLVKKYLNRDIETATYTNEVYNGSGGCFLVPKQYPVTSITTYEIYDGLDANNAEVWDAQVQGTDYDRLTTTTNQERLFISGVIFPFGTQNIRLTYVAGFTTIPENIQKACKELMIVYYKDLNADERLGKTSDVKSSAGGNFTISYDTKIVQTILKRIDSYKEQLV